MTTYKVVLLGTLSKHRSEAAAVAACKRLAKDYDEHSGPQVVAVTVSGTYRSSQVVYPSIGPLYAR